MPTGNAGSLSRCQVVMPRIYTLNAGLHTCCLLYAGDKEVAGGDGFLSVWEPMPSFLSVNQ